MKITLFGLTISSSWGNGHATPYRAILRALDQLGHELTFFERDVQYYAQRRDFLECDFCELVLYSSWEEARSRALAAAAESDVVMTASYCPEGARIIDEVLGLTRPLKVFYDLDTPITAQNLQTGDLDYLRREQMPEFDLYLTWNGGNILRELERGFGVRCARPLYGCVDPDVHHRVPARREFACGLSYMGTYAADRQQQLDRFFLEPARQIPTQGFLLAGSMYPWEWQWPANVSRLEHLAPAEHPAFYSSSRITLNITRAEMARSGYAPSGRFFEAAACGTPVMTDWFEGLDQFFHPSDELVVVRNTDEAKAALQLGDYALHRIAQRARQRTLDEHTGMHRARTLLDYFESANRTSKAARAADAFQEAA